MNNTTYTYNESPVWSETVTWIDSYFEPTLSIDQKHIFDSTIKEKEVVSKQKLYWNGKTYKRDSEEYKNLFNRAYNRLYTNEKFRKVVEATNGSNIGHSIWKTKQSETVLIKQEFCSRLMYLQN